MSVKINGTSGKTSFQADALNKINKTGGASNRQNLFRAALDEVQQSAVPSRGKELSAYRRELDPSRSTVHQHKNSQVGSGSSSATADASSPKEMGNLAASALLSLAAVSSGGKKLNQYVSALGLKSNHGTASYAAAAESSSPSKGASKIGSLSTRFESGGDGVGVIGYDDQGGTSYGTYQISSRAGTMKLFLDYLQDHEPRWAERLKGSGPANTGNRKGRMPSEWKQIAAEEPERFAKVQQSFIEETHYKPTIEAIQERTGVNLSSSPKALKEVLWSTAVQHGPRGAANIVSRAIESSGSREDASSLSKLIHSIYGSRSKQFGSSSSQVRTSVMQRFQEEKSLALAMLKEETETLRGDSTGLA